ncbi:hypothetical protein A2526_05560 [candidate division WOR-1 bacterium RIFOXYD2_FULL_36_8]|uniref:Uncharacterized protein n=1 Tax=candidate division WOR-1 bacterium RIFOXYB2_FULL_36_35 TaxID=1802578 RepID=A0A1F4RY76_UNCSA|nr:MAG: hypothetical protein A2230_04160 [candidate division WOR-1 bacterium RIFOXYA2_FULL_36_21]OGC13138.1 MAG: hypothetical protein A2290_07505 [candidate division WOR-1 bacterium RIFOXYB2_FULL_36_35]OGC14420.1 MAG: hypothetical protein A2282_08230 [candidate division WOR-1 bacterium RIFOXYA12_FULL_36_13]OGC40517.1 MAG: hypothetical protein A2526_05560 [candidate division WOR-1 bacterium RIFOXYD2_FULL_36_8]
MDIGLNSGLKLTLSLPNIDNKIRRGDYLPRLMGQTKYQATTVVRGQLRRGVVLVDMRLIRSAAPSFDTLVAIGRWGDRNNPNARDEILGRDEEGKEEQFKLGELVKDPASIRFANRGRGVFVPYDQIRPESTIKTLMVSPALLKVPMMELRTTENWDFGLSCFVCTFNVANALIISAGLELHAQTTIEGILPFPETLPNREDKHRFSYNPQTNRLYIGTCFMHPQNLEMLKGLLATFGMLNKEMLLLASLPGSIAEI